MGNGLGWLRFQRHGVWGAVRRERASVTPSLPDRDSAAAPSAAAPPHELTRVVNTDAAEAKPSQYVLPFLQDEVLEVKLTNRG